MNEEIIESSGNVFADLGFDAAEASILQMRAKLMHDLRQHIEASGMTPPQISEELGIGSARVAELMRGKWEKFSLETLITLEERIGRKVTIELAA